MIEFNEEEHKYTLKQTGDELISVTTLISKFKPVFDKETHARRVASREGLSPEYVLSLWKNMNINANNKGTKIHKLMEDYINTGIQDENYIPLYTSFNSNKKYFSGLKNISSEALLHNINYMVAGTTDLLFENDNFFSLADFKTNKRFNYTSSYNEFFLPPLTHLSVCEFNTYALQMSIYATLYEEMSKKKCKGLFVFYKRSNRWDVIPCNYLKFEALVVLKKAKSLISSNQ